MGDRRVSQGGILPSTHKLSAPSAKIVTYFNKHMYFVQLAFKYPSDVITSDHFPIRLKHDKGRKHDRRRETSCSQSLRDLPPVQDTM